MINSSKLLGDMNICGYDDGVATDDGYSAGIGR